MTRRDQAGLPQPDRASLLASAGGARDTHAARETTAAGASFFAFLSHIARSWHKGRISHKPSRSTLQTVEIALFRYMFEVILAIHKNMMTTSGTHLQGLHSTQVRHHTQIDMLRLMSVLLNI